MDWTPLRQELSTWRAARRPLEIWWRDDDAIAPTHALDTLAHLSDQLKLPVHLAVIPVHAENALASYVIQCPNLIPVVHGWAHSDHNPAGEKKAEFGRPRTTAQDELSNGKARLDALFGTRLLPMFVPPWNRCAQDFMPVLAALGYQAISAFTPRRAPLAHDGLVQINTHIDPIFWRGTRSLVEPSDLIDQVVNNLIDRREGRSDASEPLGYLTHHLVHDDAIWTFSQNLLSELMEGGAVPADIAKFVSEGS